MPSEEARGVHSSGFDPGTSLFILNGRRLFRKRARWALYSLSDCAAFALRPGFFFAAGAFLGGGEAASSSSSGSLDASFLVFLGAA